MSNASLQMNQSFDTRYVKSPDSSEFVNTVRYAYGDWVVAITLLVSSFALVNCLVRVFNVGVAQVFLDALLWYRQIVHGLFDYVLWFLKFKLSQNAKDILTIWFTIGGLSARAKAHMRSSEIYFQTLGMIDPNEQAFHRRLRKITEIPPIALMSVFLWPVILVHQMIVPHVYWSHTFGRFFAAKSKESKVVAKHDHYKFNLRVLIAIYALTLLGAASLFFMCNAMLPSVG